MTANRDYREYWSDLTSSHASHPGNRFRYDLIARELRKHGVTATRRVMDAGCGDGSLLAVVRSVVSSREMHGMDVADNVPANRPDSGICFRRQDLGGTIPGDLAGQFDLVLCSEVIEHVPDDSRVVPNLAAMVCPGGWLVLTTQSGNIYRTEQYLGHVRHYRLEDLAGRLRSEGLLVRASFRCGWPWLNLQKIAAHRFQGTVQKKIVQASELSLPVRVLFRVLRTLYGFSSRRAGPQLFLLAQKPPAGC